MDSDASFNFTTEPNARYVVVDTEHDFSLEIYDAYTSEPYKVERYGVTDNGDTDGDADIGTYEEEVRRVIVMGIRGRKRMKTSFNHPIVSNGNGTVKMWDTEIAVSDENSMDRKWKSGYVEGVYMDGHYDGILEDYMEMVDDWRCKNEEKVKKIARNVKKSIKKVEKLKS